MNTSVKQKVKLWPKFINACKSQWEGGGKRYALGEEKEYTDLICEALSGGGNYDENNWIIGQILKYCGEIINAKRFGENPQEVNYFKIAVYAFIAWIKQSDKGFTKRDKGEEFKEDSAD